LGVVGLFLFLRYLYEFWSSSGRRGDANHVVDRIHSHCYLVYFAVCCVTDHLVGLNMSPAFFLLLCLHELNCQRAASPGPGV
jgi:hypothetical protein